MDVETLTGIRVRCRRYLDSISAPLYGGKAVEFDFADAYWAFDGMLKREIAYFRVIVTERMAIGKLARKGDSLELSVTQSHPSEPDASDSHRESIQAFMIDRGYLERLVNGQYRLISSVLTGTFFMGTVRPGEFLLRGRPSITAEQDPNADPREPERVFQAMVGWFRGILSAWISGEPDGRVFQIIEDPALPASLVAGREISQVDMDSSHEDPAHVFRWKELSRGSAKAYQSLAYEECLAILERQGVKIPEHAKLAGITRYEQPDGGDCVSIRFIHHIPDPDKHAYSRNPKAVWRNRGWIDFEGDYLEYLIDASTGSLIGLDRKWRREVAGQAAA